MSSQQHHQLELLEERNRILRQENLFLKGQIQAFTSVMGSVFPQNFSLMHYGSSMYPPPQPQQPLQPTFNQFLHQHRQQQQQHNYNYNLPPAHTVPHIYPPHPSSSKFPTQNHLSYQQQNHGLPSHYPSGGGFSNLTTQNHNNTESTQSTTSDSSPTPNSPAVNNNISNPFGSDSHHQQQLLSANQPSPDHSSDQEEQSLTHSHIQPHHDHSHSQFQSQPTLQHAQSQPIPQSHSQSHSTNLSHTQSLLSPRIDPSFHDHSVLLSPRIDESVSERDHKKDSSIELHVKRHHSKTERHKNNNNLLLPALLDPPTTKHPIETLEERSAPASLNSKITKNTIILVGYDISPSLVHDIVNYFSSTSINVKHFNHHAISHKSDIELSLHNKSKVEDFIMDLQKHDATWHLIHIVHAPLKKSVFFAKRKESLSNYVDSKLNHKTHLEGILLLADPSQKVDFKDLKVDFIETLYHKGDSLDKESSNAALIKIKQACNL